MGRLLTIAPWLADFGHGILLSVLWSALFDTGPHGVVFAVGIAASVLPDLDGLKEFVRFRRIDAAQGAGDHRDGLHYPLVWFAAGALVTSFVPFYGSLATAAVLVHFLNDSWGTGWGVAWLWPFSEKSYKLFSRHDVDADVHLQTPFAAWTPEEKAAVICAKGNPNWLHDYYARPTVISIVEYGTFIIALAVLVGYLFR